jgi:hypothetical protein
MILTNKNTIAYFAQIGSDEKEKKSPTLGDYGSKLFSSSLRLQTTRFLVYTLQDFTA